MKKSRIQVSINPVLVERARRLMPSRGFDSFSEFLEDLIRQEMDRRGSSETQAKTPSGKQPNKFPELVAEIEKLEKAQAAKLKKHHDAK